MELKHHDSAASMLGCAQPYLEEREALNNLILGLSLALARSAAPPQAGYGYYTLHADSGLELVAVLTPPHHGLLLYSHAEQPQAAVALLADALRREGHTPFGVNAGRSLADYFARIWLEGTNRKAQLMMDMSAFRLDKVLPTTGADGALRQATNGDKEVVGELGRAFAREVLPEDPEVVARTMMERVDRDEVFLWEDEGAITCMAAWNRPTAHGVAINQVYTPPEYRGRGYALNAVGTLSRILLSRGYRFCCLFTDKNNPTSNSIYQKIGYRWIGDHRYYRFLDGD